MKTSMAYRLYRLYFNSNADNHQLFGSRVYNPLNQDDRPANEVQSALIRATLIFAIISVIVALLSL
jgi:hypothetical protein